MDMEEDNLSTAADLQARGSSKRSSFNTVKNTFSCESVITISTTASEDTNADTGDAPRKLKRARTVISSGTQEEHSGISIIDIDDIKDPEDEPLNKSDPSADIKYFFTPAPRPTGQAKGCMKCYLCLYIFYFSYFPSFSQCITVKGMAVPRSKNSSQMSTQHCSAI
jgi:hypothetical protein